MAKTVKEAKLVHVTVPKRTAQGRGVLKTSSMNKHSRRSYKKYRGQG